MIYSFAIMESNFIKISRADDASATKSTRRIDRQNTVNTLTAGNEDAKDSTDTSKNTNKLTRDEKECHDTDYSFPDFFFETLNIDEMMKRANETGRMEDPVFDLDTFYQILESDEALSVIDDYTEDVDTLPIADEVIDLDELGFTPSLDGMKHQTVNNTEGDAEPVTAADIMDLVDDVITDERAGAKVSDKMIHSKVKEPNHTVNLDVNNEQLKEFDDILNEYRKKGVGSFPDEYIIEKLLKNNVVIRKVSVCDLKADVNENTDETRTLKNLYNDVTVKNVSLFHPTQAEAEEGGNTDLIKMNNEEDIDNVNAITDTECEQIGINKLEEALPHSSSSAPNITITADTFSTLHAQIEQNNLNNNSTADTAEYTREDKPQTDTNSTIVLQDTDSECDGYHSSDFEFITESDAEKQGIVTKQPSTKDRRKQPRFKSQKRIRSNLATKVESPKNCKMPKCYVNKRLFSNIDSSTNSKMATSVIQCFGSSNSSTESKMATAIVSNCKNRSLVSIADTPTKSKMANSTVASGCETKRLHIDADSPTNSKMATNVIPNDGTKSYYRRLRAQFEMSESCRARASRSRVIPEGQDYIDLFLMVERPSTGSIENKTVMPPACMSVGRDLGFDLRSLRREERDAGNPQLKKEARESLQKVLEMYPGENGKRRRY